MKKKIKAAMMLIVADGIYALRNVLKVVLMSISKTLGAHRESLSSGSRKKT